MDVRLSQKGWVVIPAAMRKKYRLKPGTHLRVVDFGGVLSIVPVSKDPIKKGAGMLKGGKSLTRVAVEEHRKELERES